MLKRLVCICLLAGFSFLGLAQKINRFNPDTLITIVLDSGAVVRSARISNQLFINKILQDTSFYQAFRAMKRYSFTAENRVVTYNKKNKVEGKVYRKIFHDNSGKYKQQFLTKQDSGRVYKKNGKYQLYTVEMFDFIFMNAYNSDFVSLDAGVPGKGTNESYKDKLKTLVFRPGQPIKGVPFIGSKTAIFSPNMRLYYDYSYTSATYLDSIPVYTFKVSVKPDLSNWAKGGLMIKELITIFDKRDLKILGRYIDMKYDNLAFEFDIQMNIEMAPFDGGEVKLPTKISYQGNWNIPFKREERAAFLILHKGYKKEK